MKLIRNPRPGEIDKIIQKYLNPDGTLLHYTGHMFGIGCRLSSLKSIERINQYKQRQEKNGYIVLIPSLEWLYEQGLEIPAALQPVLHQYWPGNLTVIFELQHPMFEHVSFNGKVAFRVPDDDLLRHVITLLGEPLISTSINVSGVPAAQNLQDIQKRYDSWFDLGIIPPNTERSDPSTIIEYIDRDPEGKPILPTLKCLRESTVPFYEIKQNFHEPTLLFICTGNICRSPIAEYLFNDYAIKRNLPFRAKSAGLWETGIYISLNSLHLLQDNGIDASEHYSRRINQEILSNSWLVLTMEEAQRNDIRLNFPEFANKVFTLREYIGETGDIADPIGKELDYYKNIYGQIDDALIKLLDKLERK